MEPVFPHESNLSSRTKAVIDDTPGNGASANVSVNRLLLKIWLQLNRYASNPNLTARQGVARQLTSQSIHQQIMNEFQEVVEPRMTTVPTVPDQTRCVGWTNDFVSTTPALQPTTYLPSLTSQTDVNTQFSSADSVHPALLPEQASQLEQPCQPEYERSITYEEILATINPDATTTSLDHSGNLAIPQNSRSFRPKQSTPYDLQTIQSGRRRLSQPNLGQNLMPFTPNHRRVNSTSDMRFLCRVDGCEYTFSRARDEKRHYKSCHKSKNYPCIICNGLFTRPDSLKRHLDRTCGQNNRGKKK